MSRLQKKKKKKGKKDREWSIRKKILFLRRGRQVQSPSPADIISVNVARVYPHTYLTNSSLSCRSSNVQVGWTVLPEEAISVAWNNIQAGLLHCIDCIYVYICVCMYTYLCNCVTPEESPAPRYDLLFSCNRLVCFQFVPLFDLKSKFFFLYK